jgi:hypothetical protein
LERRGRGGGEESERRKWERKMEDAEVMMQ